MNIKKHQKKNFFLSIHIIQLKIFLFQNIARLMQNATRNDLFSLLDVMNATHDIELQIRMVSMFCVYLLSNVRENNF